MPADRAYTACSTGLAEVCVNSDSIGMDNLARNRLLLLLFVCSYSVLMTLRALQLARQLQYGDSVCLELPCGHDFASTATLHQVWTLGPGP